MSAKVGSKGQIVIEKPLRDALGVKTGYVAVQNLVEDHIVIHFYPPEHKASIKGILASACHKKVSAEEWPETRRGAWPAAVKAEWAETGLGSPSPKPKLQ